ncbi:MAG: class II fructose-1,6-bisphosphate aldolase [Tissierellia bacterium]|nr:class II fructose-1,6-bisphosphate aldolase [Tissierellia bacterium]
MLTDAAEMLKKAYEGKYAIGQFNINNLEWTKAILEVAQEKKSAVILGVSEGAARYMGGFNAVKKMVEGLDQDLNITVPVAVHLDHGTYEGAKKAIDAGFTSIMFDGSSLPIDENIEKTKEIIEICHSKGISVEAEVGGIGGEEDGVISAGELADPKECKEVASLGVDFLAAGIGNIHGVYPKDWKGLSFDRLSEIRAEIGDIPMVLHGGTGIPEDQVKKAIEKGVSKININTECQIVFTEATRKYFEEGKDKVAKGFDPRKVLKPGFEAIKDKVREKMEFFGCINSAE